MDIAAAFVLKINMRLLACIILEIHKTRQSSDICDVNYIFIKGSYRPDLAPGKKETDDTF